MRTLTFEPLHSGAILHTLAAPGFVAPPPEVRNAHLIPPDEHAAMLPGWTWGNVPPASVSLYRLQDVTLAEEGLVFLAGGDLVQASVTQHQPEEVDEARAAVASAGAIPPLDGPHVLCVKRGAANFGHWLGEMLPMALLANRLLANDIRFLVPPAEGALGATIRASLSLAGIAPERIVPLGPAPCRVRELIMVHGLSNHGHYLSPLVADELQRMAQTVAPARPGCSLWVSRNGQPRSLWLETETAAILSALGWQVLDPVRTPFLQQVALFKGAAQVAGVMGAGLANLLFAAPGTRVDVFAPAAMPDTFFYLIACLRRLRYCETRCVQTARVYGHTPWDAGLVVSLPEMMATLG